MQKRVILVHGYMGHVAKNWFPWLKTELEKRGVETIAPAMPNPALPSMESWVQTIHEAVGVLDSETVLVGHSIGGTTLLRYLETVRQPQQAAGLVLVASPVLPVEPLHLRVMNHYFADVFDFKRIKQAARRAIAIYSTDDLTVTVNNGHIIRDNLADTYMEIPDGGHFTTKNGYDTFPLVLEKILEL